MQGIGMPETVEELEDYYEHQQLSQPTAMVHIDRTRLSATARALIPLIMYVVQNSEKDKDGFYYIKKSFVRSSTGQEKANQDYTIINTAFEEIRDQKIEWNVLREDNTVDEYDINFIIGRKRNSRRGSIGFEVHEKIEKYILNPRVFAKTKIIFMLLLARKKGGFDFYSLLDDELCRHEEEYREKVISIEIIKKLLGIDKEAYKVFKDFKIRVLKPLCEEVNKNTDIQVTYEGEKYSGRKFTHIRFFIERQPWQLPLFDIQRFFSLVEEIEGTKEIPMAKKTQEVVFHAASENKIIEKFVEQGVTKSNVEKALEQWGEENITEIFDYCLDQHNKGKVQSLAGYMASCLKKGHGMKSKAEKKAEEKKANQKKKANQDKKSKEREELRKEAKGEFIKNEVQHYLSTLTDEESETLLEELKAKSPPIIRRHIKTLNHPSLTLMIANRIPDYKVRLDEYLKEI